MLDKLLKTIFLLCFNLMYIYLLYRVKDNFLCVFIGASGVMGLNYALSDFIDHFLEINKKEEKENKL